MQYDWDDNKNRANKAKHGYTFDQMTGFDWDFALFAETQYVNGEERELWIGPIGNGLVGAVITIRGEVTRVISLRSATNMEIKNWKKEFYHG